MPAIDCPRARDADRGARRGELGREEGAPGGRVDGHERLRLRCVEALLDVVQGLG